MAPFLDPRVQEKYSVNVEDVKEWIISDATFSDSNVETDQPSSHPGCKMKQMTIREFTKAKGHLTC